MHRPALILRALALTAALTTALVYATLPATAQDAEPKSGSSANSGSDSNSTSSSSSSETSGDENVEMIWETTYTASGNKVMVLRPRKPGEDPNATQAPPPQSQPTESPPAQPPASQSADSTKAAEATEEVTGATEGTPTPPARTSVPASAPVTPPPAAAPMGSESMIINDLEPEEFFPNRGDAGDGTTGDAGSAEGAQINGPGNAATTTVSTDTHALGRPETSTSVSSGDWVSSAGSGRTLPRTSSIGAYGGYPSTVGMQFAAPTDGPVAFRSGLTGMPGVGVLWTPGIELRFGQDWETYSTSSPYAFSNLYLGKEVRTGDDKEHTGLEAGLGYRWMLPDRRGVRWVAAFELGGRWSNDSAMPTTPSIRAFWMIAAP